MTAVSALPFELVKFIESPMSVVNLSIPRADITYEEFRVSSHLCTIPHQHALNINGISRFAMQKLSYKLWLSYAVKFTPSTSTFQNSFLMHSHKCLLQNDISTCILLGHYIQHLRNTSSMYLTHLLYLSHLKYRTAVHTHEYGLTPILSTFVSQLSKTPTSCPCNQN